MKLTLILFVAGALASSAALAETMVGTIIDTMCGASHTMMKGELDADCIRMCVKGSAQYALYDGKTVWRLSDQKTASNFAGKSVKVTGVSDPKTRTIKTTAIKASGD
jgi:hypothetical protein